MTYPPFILGSASPWRQTILQQHGFDFVVKPANIDEKAIRHHDPQQLVQLLAMAKARALIPHHRDQIIVTCDQVVYCQSEIREKPENEAEARRFLLSYAKHPAWTYSSVCITYQEQQAIAVDIAKILCHPIPEAVIETLIEEGEIFSCAGGFQIESKTHPDHLSPYVKAVEGDVLSVRGIAPDTLKRLFSELNLIARP